MRGSILGVFKTHRIRELKRVRYTEPINPRFHLLYAILLYFKIIPINAEVLLCRITYFSVGMMQNNQENDRIE